MQTYKVRPSTNLAPPYLAMFEEKMAPSFATVCDSAKSEEQEAIESIKQDIEHMLVLNMVYGVS